MRIYVHVVPLLFDGQTGGGHILVSFYLAFFLLSFFLFLSPELDTNTRYNSTLLLKIEFHVPKVNLFIQVQYFSSGLQSIVLSFKTHNSIHH